MDSHTFAVVVYGAFCLLDQDGRDVTPAGRKPSAFIAMLALSPNYRATRAMLQGCIWGEKSISASAASLRQLIYSLRPILGDSLHADRFNVWLDPRAFSVQSRPTKTDTPSRPEILQGLDLGEEGFEDWLRSVRQADINDEQSTFVSLVVEGSTNKQVEYQPCLKRAVVFNPPMGESVHQASSDWTHLAIHSLSSTAGSLGLCVQLPDDVSIENSIDTVGVIYITTRLYNIGSNCMATVSARDSLGVTLWNVRHELDTRNWNNNAQALLRLEQEFLSFIVSALHLLEKYDPDQLFLNTSVCTLLKGVTLPHTVSFEKLCACSEGISQRGANALGHALIGTLDVYRFGEQVGQFQLEREAAFDHFRLALQMEPNNALATAFVGHGHSFFGNAPETGLPLTETAVALGPRNPLVWALYAMSLSYTGQVNACHVAALKALSLSAHTVFRPFIESICCHSALMAGDLSAAIGFGERSLAALPGFRPTALDLCACYALNGTNQRGRQILSSVCTADPDLSLDKLRSPDFPLVNPSHRDLIVEGARSLGFPQ